MHHITVLDGYTLNPGDLSWDWLNAFGKVTVYQHSTPEQVIARAADASILFINKVKLHRKQLEQLPKLRHILVMATGTDNIDINFAQSIGISVNNCEGYSTNSVAQHVFALILQLTNKVSMHHKAIQAGKWNTQPHFSFWEQPILELTGKTLGIFGFGNIGKRVAEIAKAFQMNIIVHTRTIPADIEDEIQFVDKDTLFEKSDIITLHAPSTPKTKHLINEESLLKMKPSALLINTARGALVVEKALLSALKKGQIAGAGLDTLSQEPPSETPDLSHAPNCVITPHHAWASLKARQTMMAILNNHLVKICKS